MTFVRHVGGGLTSIEVGERLGISPRAVYHLLFFGFLEPRPGPVGVQIDEASLGAYLARGERAEAGWDRLRMDEKVLDVLAGVHARRHHFGAPWLTAYQLAVGVKVRHRSTFDEIGKPVGGAGTGEDSLARYLANQLSRRIKASAERYPIEGAFLSDEYLVDMSFSPPGEDAIRSSLVGSGEDLSLFRLRGSAPR